MAENEAEEDYMADLSIFLPPQSTDPSNKASKVKTLPPEPSKNKKSKALNWQERRKVDRERKQRQEDEQTLARCESAIPPSNLGFKMLQQMGYKPGSALGREGPGRAEPVVMEIRRSRAGLGREDPEKEKERREMFWAMKKRKNEEVLTVEFGSRQKSQWRSRRLVADFNKARMALMQLENKEIVEPEKVEDVENEGNEKAEEEEEEIITEEELTSGRTIGNAREISGLYCFEDGSKSSKPIQILPIGGTLGSFSWKHLFMRNQSDIEFQRWEIAGRRSSSLLHKHFFSSVHGGRPSSEYAKLRKESLESEFGNVLYSSQSVSTAYRFGSFLALYRAAVISFHVAKLTIWQFFVKDLDKRAVKFRETLIQLGPFYIKLGQALSTRPDILPNAYCQELAKLQDQIPPFPNHVAIQSIESQLGAPVSQIFADISPEPIAAASLGQVYKAHLYSGELVAVKVQRPGMALTLTLDALLFHMIGGQLKRFAKARKDLLVAVNEVVRHMFEEIDYILEAQNAERFASLYSCSQDSCQNNGRRKSAEDGVESKMNCVKVPKIYWDFTRKSVLTMEWINGIKLTDADGLREANLNRKQLVDEGLYCSLRQLLEEGFFHADPHPGNLVATSDGSLAYFDFGMMGDIPRHYRVGLIRMLVHFVNRDAVGLANDYLSLGFLPEGVDTQAVSDALRASFGGGTRQSQDFQAIMSQLYDVMYEFNFSLPPDYALVIRALGSLEGTAKALDPDFKVVESAYPFVIGRLLADPSPDMRKILRELLIHNDGSMRWNRFERLVAAISEQASESATEPSSNSASPSSNSTPGWKSFDMRAVVAATEDLFHFILSEKGRRVRIFLVRDIIKAADAFLEGETLRCIFDEKEARDTAEIESQGVVARLANGFMSFQKAVKLAPEVWTSMLIRLTLKREVHTFVFDILSALMAQSRHKIPETCWLCMSRFLHKVDGQQR